VFGAPPSADQLRCWIRQLSSDDFAVRAEASRNLLASGDVAVDVLTATVEKAGPEAARRAATVLEQIALHGNEGTVRHVAAGLRQSARHDQVAFDGIIKELETRQARLQRERAVLTIRSLGGRFDGDEKVTSPPVHAETKAHPLPFVGLPSALEPPPEVLADEIVPAANSSGSTGVGFIADAFASPEFVNGSESKEAELFLTIDENWRGGDAGLAALHELGGINTLRLRRAPLSNAGLAHVAALPQLQTLEIECCHFSAEALAKFRQRQPRTHVSVNAK
jgi:hypothetical protein